MKRKSLFVLPLISILTSCGTNTMGWPTIELPFSSDKVISLTMNYVEKKKGEEALSDTLVLTEPSKILEVYSFLDNYLIKEKIEKTIDTKSYYTKLSFDFYLSNYESSFYRLVYYGYGLCDGKIMLDNGEVHWVPGVFPQFYEEFKNL